MKKTSLVPMLALISMPALLLVGQQSVAQATDSSTPVKSGNEWQMPKDVLVRAKNFSQDLKKSAGLDDTTTQKAFNLYLANTKSVDEIRMGQAPPKEKKDALAANTSAFDQHLKDILTAEQFQRYQQDKKAGKIRY
jgi:hypothetical protein